MLQCFMNVVVVFFFFDIHSLSFNTCTKPFAASFVMLC